MGDNSTSNKIQLMTRGVLTEISKEDRRAPLIDPYISRMNIKSNSLISNTTLSSDPNEIIIRQRGRRSKYSRDTNSDNE